VRHDAKQTRERAKSERIRAELGIRTPEEKRLEDQRRNDEKERIAKEKTKGTPLF
jgi:hypothetical protein